MSISQSTFPERCLSPFAGERPEGSNAFPFAIPERPGTVIHMKHVIMGITAFTILTQLAFLRWWGSSLYELLLWGLIPGLLIGAGLAFAYSKNRERKRLIGNVVRGYPHVSKTLTCIGTALSTVARNVLLQTDVTRVAKAEAIGIHAHELLD
jgi:hypothetical protein